MSQTLEALIASAPKVIRRGDEGELAGFGDWIDMADLHEGCAVYCLTVDDMVMYIGQTTNLFSRIAQHRRKGVDFDGVRVLWTRRSDLRVVEARLIMHFCPPWNLVMPAWRPELLEENRRAEPEIKIDRRSLAVEAADRAAVRLGLEQFTRPVPVIAFTPTKPATVIGRRGL